MCLGVRASRLSPAPRRKPIPTSHKRKCTAVLDRETTGDVTRRWMSCSRCLVPQSLRESLAALQRQCAGSKRGDVSRLGVLGYLPLLLWPIAGAASSTPRTWDTGMSSFHDLLRRTKPSHSRDDPAMKSGTPAEKYRREAEDCQLSAARAMRPEDREAWLRLAADWERLAESAELNPMHRERSR